MTGETNWRKTPQPGLFKSPLCLSGHAHGVHGPQRHGGRHGCRGNRTYIYKSALESTLMIRSHRNETSRVTWTPAVDCPSPFSAASVKVLYPLSSSFLVSLSHV